MVWRKIQTTIKSKIVLVTCWPMKIWKGLEAAHGLLSRQAMNISNWKATRNGRISKQSEMEIVINWERALKRLRTQ